MDWLEALAALRRDGQAGVLVTVIAVEGHAPRDAGAKMVVSRHGRWGSVGGGNLEESALRAARGMLSNDRRDLRILEFGLSEHAPAEHGRQCCGGRVRLSLDPVPVRPAVAIFGLGHVGHELARLLSRHDLVVHLIDSREEVLGEVLRAGVLEGPSTITAHHAIAPESVLAELPSGTHVVVMTHDHAEDLAIVDQALRSTHLAKVGVIGSSAKWSRFRLRLAELGHDGDAISRVQCPIGIPGVSGKEPAMIALSVAADLLPRLAVQPDAEPAAPATEPAEAPAIRR